MAQATLAWGERTGVSSSGSVETHRLADDARLVESLRSGDEAAFLALVQRYHSSMVRVARAYVASTAIAEEVAQEAWLGVLKGLDGFEGRSSLKGWIFRILTNCAKSRGARETRTVPLSSLDEAGDAAEPAVDPSRFLGNEHPRWPGHWDEAPEPWADERLVAQETLERIRGAIETLPFSQRQVITLRDVEGLSAEEACEILGITEVNQRVLLHRARAKVRTALEGYMRGTGESG